ncbi:tetratricopeptide repeat protein [Pseudomonas sp. SL4(2022)]|uniref:tetratricopeptide repeat protein n=1 Tax=Pseudomonas sp. SL4(2022) TaxID=2994661 RepID=UPI002270F043|nr:tetratricopeptide repeat protein [Pseudomonas sp. SL4(2022)]WAC43839.1 tetratricopeptide repeat protein [Pseudomonas sp. SL4(2022)]
MSDARLKSRIKRIFKDEMESKGFVLKKPRIPERFLKGLRQGIEFQPGTGHLSGKYTLNVFWSFTHALDEGMSMHGTSRIGALTGGGDTWFSRQDENLESDFSAVSEIIKKVVLPYLDKYNSIESILAGVKSGELDTSRALGVDAGWREFNLGYCFASLGNKKEAVKHYSAVIEMHSTHTVEWVQNRKQAAVSEISRLCP